MARHTPVALIAAFCLTTAAASAQVTMGTAPVPGVRYNPAPPKPDPPPANPDPRPYGHQPSPHHPPYLTTPRDVFLAGPDTYKPRRDTFPSIVPFAFYPTAPELVFVDRPLPPVVVERTKVVYVERPAERGSGAVVEPAGASIRRTGTQKTMYVIPRCYAGDKLPIAQELPAGCDIREMRIIRP